MPVVYFARKDKNAFVYVLVACMAFRNRAFAPHGKLSNRMVCAFESTVPFESSVINHTVNRRGIGNFYFEKITVAPKVRLCSYRFAFRDFVINPVAFRDSRRVLS